MSPYATPKDLIPEAHCVLGTMLRPFSIGHRLLLGKVESQFAKSSELIASPDELALAVFICASRYSEAHESLVRGDWERDFKAWLKKLKPRWFQRSRFDHDAELAKFINYLNAGNARPPVWKHNLPGGVEITAPDECLLVCCLASAGFDHRAVLEMFLPEVWYFYYTIRELNQANELTNPAKWRRIFYTEDHHRSLHPETN